MQLFFRLFPLGILFTLGYFHQYLIEYFSISGFSFLNSLLLIYALLLFFLVYSILNLFERKVSTLFLCILYFFTLYIGLNGLIYGKSYFSCFTFGFLLSVFSFIGVLGSYLFNIKKKHTTTSSKSWNITLIVATLLINTFIIIKNPPYTDDFEAHPTLVENKFNLKEYLHEGGYYFNNTSFDGVVIFATWSCPHCQNILRKIEAYIRRNPDQKSHFLLLLGANEEQLDVFKQQTQSTIPLIRIDNEDRQWFFQQVRGSVPSVYYFQEGQSIKIWNQRSISLKGLDQIVSLLK